MINLLEVANTISSYLNGTNADIPSDVLDKRPALDFMVRATGFRLDDITQPKNKENYLPVVVDSLGGNIQAIPNLQQANYTVPITIFFPISKRDDIFYLNEYLADCFVGRIIDFGTHSGKGVCNISPAQYGEIEDIDLQQFAEWTGQYYGLAKSITDTYMTVSFQLYITTAKNVGKENGPIYGNDMKLRLTLTIGGGGQPYFDDNPIFADSNITSSSGNAAEQILGELITKGYSTNTAYAVPLRLIVKNTEFYEKLLQLYFNREISKIVLHLYFVMTVNGKEITFHFSSYATNVSLIASKGNLVSIEMQLAERKLEDA